MPGSQTATVTGPKGEEIHVDNHGRVKVQFHWDRYGKKDENTSCWIRVSYPSAGSGFGFQSHPRIGDEVIVDFLEGDPDRPIITGSVYNGSNPGTFKLPDHKTRSVIRADSTPGGGGFNELHFENKKGSEAVYLQAEKDWNVLVKNNKGQTVGGNNELTIGGNSDTNVTGSLTKTAKDITITAVSGITLVCGGSIIVMDEKGVVIKGREIHLNP
jgi:type VI secretion system secreted protein VgrG